LAFKNTLSISTVLSENEFQAEGALTLNAGAA